MGLKIESSARARGCSDWSLSPAFDAGKLSWPSIVALISAHQSNPSPALLRRIGTALISVPKAVSGKRRSSYHELLAMFYISLPSAVRRFRHGGSVMSQFTYFCRQLECQLKDVGYDEGIIPRPYRLRKGKNKSPAISVFSGDAYGADPSLFIELAKEGIYYDSKHPVRADGGESGRGSDTSEDECWRMVHDLEIKESGSTGRWSDEKRATVYCDLAGTGKRTGDADLHRESGLHGNGDRADQGRLHQEGHLLARRIRLGKCHLTSRSKQTHEVCPDPERASDGCPDRYFRIDGADSR